MPTFSNRLTIKELLMPTFFSLQQNKTHYILPHLFIKMLKPFPTVLSFCLLGRGVDIRICLFQVSLKTPNWIYCLVIAILL